MSDDDTRDKLSPEDAIQLEDNNIGSTPEEFKLFNFRLDFLYVFYTQLHKTLDSNDFFSLPLFIHISIPLFPLFCAGVFCSTISRDKVNIKRTRLMANVCTLKCTQHSDVYAGERCTATHTQP